MSAPAGGAALSAYRALLRAVSRHVTSVSGNGLFRDALRAEFRAGAAQRDPAAAAAAVARAQDAAFYVTAVNEHKARPRCAPQRACAPPGLARGVRSRARSAYALLRSAPQELLLSYGISIDKEADTKARVKHTAARVGLAVAEFDERGVRTDAPPRTK
jgi:hypothetical protein